MAEAGRALDPLVGAAELAEVGRDLAGDAGAVAGNCLSRAFAVLLEVASCARHSEAATVNRSEPDERCSNTVSGLTKCLVEADSSPIGAFPCGGGIGGVVGADGGV